MIGHSVRRLLIPPLGTVIVAVSDTTHFLQTCWRIGKLASVKHSLLLTLIPDCPCLRRTNWGIKNHAGWHCEKFATLISRVTFVRICSGQKAKEKKGSKCARSLQVDPSKRRDTELCLFISNASKPIVTSIDRLFFASFFWSDKPGGLKAFDR